MAKNVYSLQLLRNSTIFADKETAIAGITSASTQDGVIKLARYTEGEGAQATTKTIFGIYHDATMGGASGYTIYDSYQEAIAAMQDQINAISAATSGASITLKDVQDMLGTGVTTGNSVTQQLGALSGDAQSSSGDTSVAGAKKYADGKIDALDYTGVTTGDAVVITNVTETDGVVSATPANVGNLKLTDYTSGSSSADIVATDTINQAFGKIENQIAASTSGATEINAKLGTGVTTANTATQQLEALSGNASSTSAETSVAGAKKYADGKIDALDYTDAAVTGNYVSKVDEVNGVISVTRVALPTVAAISEAGKPITAVSESLGTISATAGTINAEYVNVTGSVFSSSTVQAALEEIETEYKAADAAIVGDATTSGDTLGKLEDRIEALDADAKEYSIVKTTTGLPATIKESYSLQDADGHVSGDTIDIPKDSHIVSITYITTGEHAQNLEYVYIDASGNTQTTYVDMSSLVLETEFASGVTVTDHIAHGVVDSTSETFLTVGAGGFKLSGVQDAIDAAVSAATDDIEDLSGKTVTEIGSSNSSIDVATAATTAADGTVKYDVTTDASKVKMTGFTADASGFTAITSASTVTEAVKAIETEVIANEQTTAQALNDLEDTKLENIIVNGVTGTTGANNTTSVTVDGSQLNLSSGYAKAASNTPVATGDSVDVAIGKLEKQIEDATAGGLQAVDASSGITVSAVAQNRQTITAKLTAAADLPQDIAENAIKFDSTNNGMYVEYIDAGTY